MNTYTKTLLNGIKAYVKKNTANDWDAEDGELGFISNKPFYETNRTEHIDLFDSTVLGMYWYSTDDTIDSSVFSSQQPPSAITVTSGSETYTFWYDDISGSNLSWYSNDIDKNENAINDFWSGVTQGITCDIWIENDSLQFEISSWSPLPSLNCTVQFDDDAPFDVVFFDDSESLSNSSTYTMSQQMVGNDPYCTTYSLLKYKSDYAKISSNWPDIVNLDINGDVHLLPKYGEISFNGNAGFLYGVNENNQWLSNDNIGVFFSYDGQEDCYNINVVSEETTNYNHIIISFDVIITNVKQIDKKFIPIQDTIKPIITSYNQDNEQLQWNREYQLLVESDTEFYLADPQVTYPEEINLYFYSTGNHNISFYSNDPIFTDNNMATYFSSMAVTQGMYEISLKQISINGSYAILCAMRTPSALPSGA